MAKRMETKQMKLTKAQLKQIIKEELAAVLNEDPLAAMNAVSQDEIQKAAAVVTQQVPQEELQDPDLPRALQQFAGKSPDEIAAMLQPGGPMQEGGGSNVQQAMELAKAVAQEGGHGAVIAAVAAIGASALGVSLAPAMLVALAISSLLTIGAHNMPEEPLSMHGQDKFRRHPSSRS